MGIHRARDGGQFRGRGATNHTGGRGHTGVGGDGGTTADETMITGNELHGGLTDNACQLKAGDGSDVDKAHMLSCCFGC